MRRNPKRAFGFVAVVLLLSILAAPGVSASPPYGTNHRVNDDVGSATQERVAAAADASGYVYAAWQDSRNGDADVYFARSADGGLSFGASQRLGGNQAVGTSQARPAIALGPRGEIVVVWQDDRHTYMAFDIFAAVSVDRGQTFSAPVQVDDGPAGAVALSPSVALDASGAIYVAWQESSGGNGDIRLARGSLSPFQFGASVRVDDDLEGRGTQASPSVAVGSLGSVFVAYHDNRTGDANVYLATSADGAATFGASVRIDDTGTATTAQGLVSLTTDSLDNLYAAWQDSRKGYFAIYFAMSTDGGRSFSANVRVFNAGSGAAQTVPDLVVGAAGTVYVTWQQAGSSDADIYASYSRDGGASFASAVRVDDAGDSSTNPAPQYSPVIVESKTGLVTILFQDARSDNGDIYASTAAYADGSAFKVSVTLRPTWLAPGERTNVTIYVTSNGTGFGNAAVDLFANVSGSFGPVVSVGAGYYSSSFTPLVSVGGPGGTIPVAVVAYASASGFVSGAGQALLKVSPRIGVSIRTPWTVLAVGQTMDLTATASAGGSPLSGASVTAVVSVGGSLGSGAGTTDASGSWTTSFRPLNAAGGTTVTVTVSVSREGFIPGSSVVAIHILADARPLEIQISSDRSEMMSNELAKITVLLSSGGVGVPGASVLPYSRGGNATPVTDFGNGTYAFRFNASWVKAQSWVVLYVTAKVGGYSDAKGKVNLLVDHNLTNPQSPTQLYLFAYPATPQVPAGHSVVVTVVVYTREGYAVSGGTVTPSMRGTLGTLGPATDRYGGYYTFTFTASVVGTLTYVTIQIQAAKYGYATGSTRVTLAIVP